MISDRICQSKSLFSFGVEALRKKGINLADIYVGFSIGGVAIVVMVAVAARIWSRKCISGAECEQKKKGFRRRAAHHGRLRKNEWMWMSSQFPGYQHGASQPASQAYQASYHGAQLWVVVQPCYASLRVD